MTALTPATQASTLLLATTPTLVLLLYRIKDSARVILSMGTMHQCIFSLNECNVKN